MDKKFINLNPMQTEILEKITTEFLSKEHYYSDSIEIKVSLKDMIEQKLKEQEVIMPEVFITVSAAQKMRHLVDNNTGEVAWHGIVEQHDNKYIITDILVFPQVVTSATANGVDGKYEMWIANQPDEIFDHLRFHGHSHVNMGVTPSSVDENYYSNLMTQVQDFYITLITNKSSALHVRFYDKINNVYYTEMPLHMCLEDGTTLDNWYDTVKELITVPITTPVATPTPHPLRRVSSLKDLHAPSDDDYYKNYDYDYDYGVYKKKDTNKPRFIIQTPNNEIRNFPNIDYAINYIYKQYVDKAPKINKNVMRRSLTKDGALAFDSKKNNFLDSLKNRALMEYAILNCDFWEVMEGEPK